jgi:hypothetical protein
VAEGYAARLRDDFEREMQSRATVYTARWNNPSQMGHPCDRFLVLRRTKGQLQKAPSWQLQARFMMGTEIGKLAVRFMMEQGWEIRSIERPSEWPEYQISGRPDMEARPPGSKAFLPFEVKSVHPNLMAGVRSLRDVLSNRNWRVRMWPSQLMTYELLDNHEEGVFLPISLSGLWQAFAVPLDYDHAETLLKQCERVNAHIAAGTEPEPICDPEVCPGCWFFQTEACDIRLAMAADTTVVTDEEVIGDVRRMLELKPQASEYEALRNQLKVRFEGVEQALVPDVAMVTGKWTERHVKAQEARTDKYWSPKYLPLRPEEGDDAD